MDGPSLTASDQLTYARSQFCQATGKVPVKKVRGGLSKNPEEAHVNHRECEVRKLPPLALG